MKSINLLPGSTAAWAAYMCHQEGKSYTHDGINYRIKSLMPNGNRLRIELVPEK